MITGARSSSIIAILIVVFVVIAPFFNSSLLGFVTRTVSPYLNNIEIFGEYSFIVIDTETEAILTPFIVLSVFFIIGLIYLVLAALIAYVPVKLDKIFIKNESFREFFDLEKKVKASDDILSISTKSEVVIDTIDPGLQMNNDDFFAEFSNLHRQNPKDVFFISNNPLLCSKMQLQDNLIFLLSYYGVDNPVDKLVNNEFNQYLRKTVADVSNDILRQIMIWMAQLIEVSNIFIQIDSEIVRDELVQLIENQKRMDTNILVSPI